LDPEWDLFESARKGDNKSWQALLEKYRKRLGALALMITGSADVAADVVQETFSRAFSGKLRDRGGTLSGFLGTIAFRLAVKEKNRSSRVAPLDRTDFTGTGPDPLDQIIKREQDRHVAQAIGWLDDDHREVLMLRCYADRSYKEIAQLLGLPLGTVKSRMFYAVKSCREILRKKGVLD